MMKNDRIANLLQGVQGVIKADHESARSALEDLVQIFEGKVPENAYPLILEKFSDVARYSSRALGLLACIEPVDPERAEIETSISEHMAHLHSLLTVLAEKMNTGE